MRITMPLKGRLVHGEGGRARFQRYGRTSSQVHHSIKRSELNSLLINAAEAQPNVQVQFHKRYLKGAKDGGGFQAVQEKMTALDKETKEKVQAVLTPDQRKQWKQMIGEEFKLETGFGKKKKKDAE